jgi:hypothetical protein
MLASQKTPHPALSRWEKENGTKISCEAYGRGRGEGYRELGRALAAPRLSYADLHTAIGQAWRGLRLASWRSPGRGNAVGFELIVHDARADIQMRCRVFLHPVCALQG